MNSLATRTVERISREEAIVLADGIYARFQKIRKSRLEKLKRAAQTPDPRREANRSYAS